MKRVILTGFMGTGKSTAGRLVARRAGVPFVDLDEVIECGAGMTVAELFAAEGEAAFRALESRTLSEVLQGSARIIATGGGTLMSAENREMVAEHEVLCLSAATEELEGRLHHAQDRPLLAGGKDRWHALLAERLPTYETFRQLDTTGLPVEAVAELIVATTSLAEVGSLAFEWKRASTILGANGLLNHCGAAMSHHGLSGRVLLVSDTTLQALGMVTTLESSLRDAGMDVATLLFPPGEDQKSLAGLSRIYDACLAHGMDRRSIVVALGGGVVCDLAGLAAATYVRGVRFVSVPTTLLAQVDAAIGGKVGIDVGIKNIVGAFHPASLVVVDPNVLTTLPPAMLSDGLAEVVKIAVIRRDSLLIEVEGFESADDILLHPDVIRQAATEKVRVVQADPYESGERMLLNFGHTIGHALEQESGYALSHGQAVAIGMMAETSLAVEAGWCDTSLLFRLSALLRRLDLPVSVPANVLNHTTLEDLMRIMHHDKKRRGRQLRCALPVAGGHGRVFDVHDNQLQAALKTVVPEPVGGWA